MSLYPSFMLVSSKRYRLEQPGTLPANKTFYRVLHEKELGANLPHTTPADRPEVRPLYPNHFSPFAKTWQILSKAMNSYCNPSNWTQIYDYRLWVCNNNGFGDADKPRANYITGEDLTENLPKVEALTCGGNLLSVLGETDQGYIVETLDWRNSAPSVFWMDARPWLCTWAVNMGSDGMPRRFSQGMQINGYVPGVRHPLIADPSRFVITIPKWRVIRWSASTVPDPYKIYITQ